MSIFNKKEIKESIDHREYRKLLSLLNDIDFMTTIENIHISKVTLDFYEKGSPDWESENNYFKSCQKNLLTKIGVYDGIRRDIIELLDNSNVEDLKGFQYPIPSHEKIRVLTRIILRD